MIRHSTSLKLVLSQVNFLKLFPLVSWFKNWPNFCERLELSDAFVSSRGDPKSNSLCTLLPEKVEFKVSKSATTLQKLEEKRRLPKKVFETSTEAGFLNSTSIEM